MDNHFSRQYSQQSHSLDRNDVDILKSALSKAFSQAAENLVNDPLMSCFRSSPESQNYMMDRMEEVILEAVKLSATDQLISAQKTISELKSLLRSEDTPVRKDPTFMSHHSTVDQLSVSRHQADGRQRHASKFDAGEEGGRLPSILADRLASLETRCEVLQAERDKAVLEADELRDVYDQACSSKGAAEKALRKAEWELREKQEVHERQIGKLTEEIGFLRAKQVAAKDNGDSKEVSMLRSTLVTLETRFREVKDLYNQQKRELEESNFECETLKSTVDRLKTECQDSSDREASERKHRHGLEMTIIELKKKVAEMTTAYKETEEAFRQTLNEMNLFKSEMNQLNESLKNEKRRSLALDRELEQAKFLAERKDRDYREHANSYEEQFKLIKAESSLMKEKLDAVMNEKNMKNSRDSKESAHLAIKVREMDAKQNDLHLTIEDLQKKLSFYKEKALKKDYESVSKNSILEKLANLSRSLNGIKEGWSTEKFIIKQEMSCISSHMLRNAETYYQQIKPFIMNRHLSSNFSSKATPLSIMNIDSNARTETFGLPSPDFASGKHIDNFTSVDDFKYMDIRNDRQSMDTENTSKKPNQSSSLVTKISLTGSCTNNQQLRSPLEAIPQNLIKDQLNMLSNRPNACATSRFNTGQFGNEFKNISQYSEDIEKNRQNYEVPYKRIDTDEFMARVNARVQEKLVKPSGISTEVSTSFVTPAKQNTENVNSFVLNAVSTFGSNDQSLPTKSTVAKQERIDYEKIERESEEIAKRIQALKLKDFSQFK